MGLFDSHNHLQSERFGGDVAGVVEEMRGVGISGCVVNATEEGDWPVVAGLARDFEGFVRPAYGVHPWCADGVVAGWEGRLWEVLLADPGASVGEVGVDGWVDSPGMAVQREVFLKQVKVAVELERVMTVHCLKGWEVFFSVMDEMMDEVGAWPERFLMHSFGGSAEVAERLLKRGAWFSFSGYFLEGRKGKVLEVFRGLPRDRILLETDGPEMMPPVGFVEFPLGAGVNHPANLRRIAEGFEREMGEGVLEVIEENGRRFWGVD